MCRGRPGGADRNLSRGGADPNGSTAGRAIPGDAEKENADATGSFPPTRGRQTRRLRCYGLLLYEVDNGHDRGRLRQLDAQFTHDRTEVFQELIERFLILPDVEDLKLPVFSEARVELHGAFRCPGLTQSVASLPVLLNSHVLGHDVDANHGPELLWGDDQHTVADLDVDDGWASEAACLVVGLYVPDPDEWRPPKP